MNYLEVEFVFQNCCFIDRLKTLRMLDSCFDRLLIKFERSFFEIGALTAYFVKHIFCCVCCRLQLMTQKVTLGRMMAENSCVSLAARRHKNGGLADKKPIISRLHEETSHAESKTVRYFYSHQQSPPKQYFCLLLREKYSVSKSGFFYIFCSMPMGEEEKTLIELGIGDLALKHK